MTTEHISTGKIIIRHRINTIELLKEVPSEYGIEFDIREGPDGIIVTHDPWSKHIQFEDFLKNVHHVFYIVNVKSEGIEYEALRLLEKYNIQNFFLLDCSFPMIVRLSKRGERRIAIRVSEYESIETAKTMKQFVDWVWLDSFNSLPSFDTCQLLRDLDFKVCIVSPELQGRIDDITNVKNIIDAVCTKTPNLWL
jgi:hypothetical protein